MHNFLSLVSVSRSFYSYSLSLVHVWGSLAIIVVKIRGYNLQGYRLDHLPLTIASEIGAEGSSLHGLTLFLPATIYSTGLPARSPAFSHCERKGS